MPPLTLKGKLNTATVFTHNIEEQALHQVVAMLDEPITENTTVAIMPDVHAGKGSTIGTTIKLPPNRADWKVCPNVVGVDIGCSMRAIQIAYEQLDLEKLDRVIHEKIPAGFKVHNKPIANRQHVMDLINRLSFKLDNKKIERLLRSCGTLGGGNHYIEVGMSPNGETWATVHSGSRHLGVLVASHHQQIAENQMIDTSKVTDAIVHYLIENGRQRDIQAELKQYAATNQIPTYLTITGANTKNKDLAYLEGTLLDNYLNDIKVAQEYSTLSRQLMLQHIATAMDWTVIDEFESMHNYIDLENGIIRKGATSAQAGERLIIPLNMRDGSIFATGKGNAEWNCSAPHGAGRLLSRSKAKEVVAMTDYIDTMHGIYTSSVTEETRDESPFAYKAPQEIINAIQDTVTIDMIVKPIYNFKAH